MTYCLEEEEDEEEEPAPPPPPQQQLCQFVLGPLHITIAQRTK